MLKYKQEIRNSHAADLLFCIPKDREEDHYFWLRAACAAARRAMGTRKGEQLT